MATYNVDSLSILTSPLDDLSSGTFIQMTTSDVFANDGVTFLWVKAAATTTGPTLTFANNGASTATPPGLGPIQISTYTFAITAGVAKEYLFGPFAPGRFNNASGQVTVTTPGSLTGLSARAVRFTPVP